MFDPVLLSASHISGDAPNSLEYAPGGVHLITPSVNGKPEEITLVIEKEDAEILNAQLQTLLETAENGNSSRPYIDFDHEGGKAAALPKKFFWEDGLRLEVEWTKAGREAIEGREYSYFSPEMLFDRKSGRITGLPQFGPIGGLVNTPAFQTIERIAARYAVNNDKKKNMSEPNNELLQERTKQVEKLTADNAALEAKLAELQKTNEELVAAKAALEEEGKTLKESETTLKASLEEIRKEKIEAEVDTLIEAGRLKKESKDSLVSAAMGQADDGKAIFDALPEVQKVKGHRPFGDNKQQKDGDDGDDKKLTGIDRITASIAKNLEKKGLN